MVRAIMHGCNGHMGQVITGIVKEDKDAQKDTQQRAGDNRRDGLDTGRQGKDKVHQHANGANDGDDAKD